jgi:hypothetical protein
MALDVWFQEDVARILTATQETMSSSMRAVSPLDPQVGAVYQQGFADALRAVAIAFGVGPVAVRGPAARTTCARVLHSGDVITG